MRRTISLGSALVGRDRKASRACAQQQPHLGDPVRQGLPGPQEDGDVGQRQLSISSRSAT
jgi:hypothetical protein